MLSSIERKDLLSGIFGPDEGSVSQVGKRLFDLFVRVHHERTVSRDRLTERFGGNEQEPNRIDGGRSFDIVAFTKDDQLCLCNRLARLSAFAELSLSIEHVTERGVTARKLRFENVVM